MQTSASHEKSRSSDRRLLARPEPGRRTSDSARTEIFPNADEHVVRLSPAVAYATTFAALVAIGIGLVAYGNVRLAPFLYSQEAIDRVAASLAAGNNHTTFDLNIDTRALRRAHIRLLSHTPDVVVFGASHWQEADSSLLPGRTFYNAHVHKDYYEDILSVAEMLTENSRLPKQLIITIRDNTFLPANKRTDSLWLTGVPEYRKMATRLGLRQLPWLDTVPASRIRDMTSLSLLFKNARRLATAHDYPTPTKNPVDEHMDTLRFDGSIVWSGEHRARFSAESSNAAAVAFAESRRNDPPEIDPDGVEAVHRLLGFLRNRQVDVFLAHPPFNPQFYDRVVETPFMQGLHEVIKITRQLAERHNLHVIGSFNPHEVGCDASMYIDAEHSGPACLQKILAEYLAIESVRRVNRASAN